jgi:hypothetical protein
MCECVSTCSGCPRHPVWFARAGPQARAAASERAALSAALGPVVARAARAAVGLFRHHALRAQFGATRFEAAQALQKDLDVRGIDAVEQLGVQARDAGEQLAEKLPARGAQAHMHFAAVLGVLAALHQLLVGEAAQAPRGAHAVQVEPLGERRGRDLADLRERADHSPFAARDAEAAFDHARRHAAAGACRTRQAIQKQVVQGTGSAQGARIGKSWHGNDKGLWLRRLGSR